MVALWVIVKLPDRDTSLEAERLSECVVVSDFCTVKVGVGESLSDTLRDSDSSSVNELDKVDVSDWLYESLTEAVGDRLCDGVADADISSDAVSVRVCEGVSVKVVDMVAVNVSVNVREAEISSD